MKINDLLKLNPINKTKDIYPLLRFLPELPGWVEEIVDNNTQVELHQLIYQNIDGRRIVDVSAVYYNDSPVMIYRRAGREGDDFEDSYVVNRCLYHEMINYLFSLIQSDVEVYNLDEDIPSLDELYGKPIMEWLKQ